MNRGQVITLVVVLLLLCIIGSSLYAEAAESSAGHDLGEVLKPSVMKMRTPSPASLPATTVAMDPKSGLDDCDDKTPAPVTFRSAPTRVVRSSVAQQNLQCSDSVTEAHELAGSERP